ncbi:MULTISPECIES: hypothetical protein [unclassified Pseudoalteromonas]|uniref:hypothetical protein n=1 Tax=unclassified Pseudoalteromonas TaxID=194690 RepID=UPI001600974E|nr:MULTISPECIES: hypothetical protein [unclassified Pseudoalteromonas]MBB1335265.1 hypothetical protein [Pseudoalteromonas sp. SR41-6]MBB1460725.1 hypothetical protein [Pseudoalteromonas sp. SG41-8]
MSAQIQSIFNHDQHLACVSRVDSFGRVKAVLINNVEHQVIAQGAHVSIAEVGANVLLVHSAQGFIVTALLAQADQVPAAQINNSQGHIVIEAQQSISLQTAKGSVEVYADGTIVLEGQDITANSEQDLTLAGWPIRLN